MTQGYLSPGYITNYDELIDVGNNFNPSTGVFTVGNKEEDEGTYVFLFSGRKWSGKDGHIKVYKNGRIFLNMKIHYFKKKHEEHVLHLTLILP